MDYTVYQRKSDNKWVGCFYYKDDNNNRKSIVAYGKTEREATKKIREKIVLFELGELKRPNKDTLVAFLTDYINKNSNGKGKQWTVTTEELYISYLNQHIKPYYKDTKLINIKPIDLDNYYEYKLDSGLSGNTVIKLHKFLNAAFNYAVKKDIMQSNPCLKATAPRTTEYKPNIYEPEQFNELWQHIKNDYDRVPISLGAGCGLRRGEIFGLKWSDIDFNNNTITIERTKTRLRTDIEKLPKNETSARTINAPSYVMDILKGYKKERQVFALDNYIMEVTPSYYSKRFKKLLTRFNLPPTRLHDLRHYNATLMMNAGIPDKIAADRLGHKDTTMLKKVYQHTHKSMDKIASDKINELLAR